ncbi:MAG: hypothetical protein KDA42_14800 [Planctomycetales bacterium]|nr:hypothetical protein [Planctomycetales bacterium]
MPAPIENKNAIRHGLTTGKLPAGCGYVERLTNQLRRALESAVLDIAGEIGLFAAATINTACRWERHALLAQRWLRRGKDLTPADKLAFSRDVARASAERDKCIKALGLDHQDERDAWSVLDAVGVPPTADAAGDDSTDPSGDKAAPEAQGAA